MQKKKAVIQWDGLVKWVSAVWMAREDLGALFEPWDESHVWSEKPFKDNMGFLQQAYCLALLDWVAQRPIDEKTLGVKTTVASISQFMRRLKRKQAIWAHMDNPNAPIHASQRM